MSKEQNNVPDAWEADWESLADKSDTTNTPPKKVSSKVTKAQRRAAQAEFNRKLWEEAETPQTFHYVEARSSVPLKQEFKPAVTVLSRRPQIASRNNNKNIDAAGEGISNLSINGGSANISDSDEDSVNKPPELTPEERQAKALKDREEKQRKYEEARERLFGNSSSAPGSGASSPGGTPPPSRNRDRDSGFDGSGTRGGGRGRNRGYGGVKDNNSINRQKRDPQGGSIPNKQRQLYDPSYSPKPTAQRRTPQGSTERADGDQQQQTIRPTRNPRNPDGSGRGGFGFSPRGRGTGTLLSRDPSA